MNREPSTVNREPLKMILARYILREHIVPFFLGLLLLTTILIMNKLFISIWSIVGRGVPGNLVISLLWLSLPSIITLTVPMAVLVSVLMAFGRLSADFEIVAIKVAGLNPLKLIISPLVLSLLLTITMIWFNNHILPDANHRLKNLTIDISQKKPAFRISAMTLIRDFEDYDILARDVDHRTGKIYDVTITEKDEGRMIISQKGTVDTRGDAVYIHLLGGEIHETDPYDATKYRKVTFKEHTIVLPVDTAFIRKERSYRGERELSAEGLRDRIYQIRRKSPTSPARERSIARLKVEYHKKFAIPISCVIFTIMGVPLAMKIRRKGITGGFGVSLLFFMFYYICLIGGEKLGDRAVIPAWLSMWFANIVLGTIGLILCIRSR